VVLSHPAGVELIDVSDLDFVLRRLPNAVEFFTKSRRSFLVEFSGADTPDLIDRIVSLYTSFEARFFDDIQLTQLWRTGQITTFTYLLRLNLFAGRSFHRDAVYPIFPAVLGRDLSQPLGLDHALVDQFYLFAEGPLPLAVIRGYVGPLGTLPPAGRFELIPEFFCLPYLFANAMQTPADFVYRNRKALESADAVHAWIDCLFGARQRERYHDKSLYKEELYESIWTQPLEGPISRDIDENGRVPHRIFERPHPARAPTEIECAPACTLRLAGDCRWVFVAETSLAVIDDSGLQFYHIDLSGQAISAPVQVEVRDAEVTRAIRAHNYIVAQRTSDFVFGAPGFAGYYSVSPRTGKVTRVQAPCPVVSLAVSGAVTIAAGPIAAAVFTDDHFVVCVRPFNRVITCACASESFGVVVLGSEGVLTVWEARTGLLIREIEIDGAIPHKVAIGEGFGFIIAAVTERLERQPRRFLSVFTINGLFVRKREIADDVSVWSLWTSSKGIDFVVFATVGEAASFAACELCALNFSAFKCKGSHSPIVSVSYLVGKAAFVVAQADGRVNVFGESSDHLEAPS
jgi:hypothetical protein